MSENTIIYVFIAFTLYMAYKKYTQYKVLKLVPTLLEQGGQIIDVRTEEEFVNAHKSGSVNIPLHKLEKEIKQFDNTKAIILCCASGSRSAMAKRILLSNGFENVHNAGKWKVLKKF